MALRKFWGAALVQLAVTMATLVPTQYCVVQNDGTLVPWNFDVDDGTGFVYLTLASVAPRQFTDIFDILETINATGEMKFGLDVANIASIVDSTSKIPGTTATGSVITQWSRVHLATVGPVTLSPPVGVSIDLFDTTFTTNNQNSAPMHAYFITGQASNALYATADGCIGGYSDLSDCLNPYAPSYPCAFANVDLTSLPFSLVNDFTIVGAGAAGNIFVDAALKTVNLYGGGGCGFAGPSTGPGHTPVQKLNEKLVICPSATSTPTSTASTTASSTGTPSCSTTGTPSTSVTGTPSSSHTGTSSSSHTGTSSSSHTGTASSSSTGTSSSSHTGTSSSSHTGTSSSSHTGTSSSSHTGTSSSSHTGTPSHSHSGTASASHTGTPSQSHTRTPSSSSRAAASASCHSSMSSTATRSASSCVAASVTATKSASKSHSRTASGSRLKLRA